MMLIFLFSCASEEMKKAAASNSINAYARLVQDASWTYREDLVEEDTAALPNDRDLIRARVVEANAVQEELDEYSSSLEGSYRVELRQGARWFDAQLYGELSWRLEEGLFLDNWSFEFASGSGSYPIVSAVPFEERTVSEGDWNCSLEELETLWTWYATYENVLRVTCTGGGPAGVFTFAEQAGLIAMELGDHELYLIAPW